MTPLTAAQGAAATHGSAANDTTSYVTNADGSVNISISNAQGQVIEISTHQAPVIFRADLNRVA